MQSVILLYTRKYTSVLHKSYKAQYIYTSCIPPRLSYNPDKALLFYGMIGQRVKLCELISGN
jgi:hypothetical protein